MVLSPLVRPFVLLTGTLLAARAALASPPFQTRLIADVGDVDVSFGLVLPQANTVALDQAFQPPPGSGPRVKNGKIRSFASL